MSPAEEIELDDELGEAHVLRLQNRELHLEGRRGRRPTGGTTMGCGSMLGTMVMERVLGLIWRGA